MISYRIQHWSKFRQPLVSLLILLPVLLFTLTALSPLQKSSRLKQQSIAVGSGELESRSWILKELQFIQNNERRYYNQSDRSENNIDLDQDTYRFDSGGTGIYRQADGKIFLLKWKYLNQDFSSIRFVIAQFRNGQSLEVTWEKIRLRGDTLSYLEYYTHADGTASLGYGERVASPVELVKGSEVSGKP